MTVAEGDRRRCSGRAEQLPLELQATDRPPRLGFNSTHWAGRGRGRQAESESFCAATGGWDSARGVSHRPIDCRDAVVGLARSVSQDSRHRDLKRPAVFGGIIRLRKREGERPFLLTAEVGRPSGGSLTPQRKRNYRCRCSVLLLFSEPLFPAIALVCPPCEVLPLHFPLPNLA